MSLCREADSSEAAPVEVTITLPLKFKGKGRTVGRGSAGWEVQEVTGERLFRNAAFPFLSPCWKLPEEGMHW